jgi:hypothetical protein
MYAPILVEFKSTKSTLNWATNEQSSEQTTNGSSLNIESCRIVPGRDLQ